MPKIKRKTKSKSTKKNLNRDMENIRSPDTSPDNYDNKTESASPKSTSKNRKKEPSIQTKGLENELNSEIKILTTTELHKKLEQSELNTYGFFDMAVRKQSASRLKEIAEARSLDPIGRKKV